MAARARLALAQRAAITPPPAEIDGAVTLALTGDLVTVTGPTFTAQVSFEGVPTLTSVRDYSGRECLTRPSPLACFSLDDAPLMPEAFEDFEVRQEGHTVRCKFGTRDRKIGLVAVFTMAPEHEFGAAGGLRLDLRVTNSADGVRSPLASFPVVSGLDLGAGCRYLFPQRGGCSSDRPLDIQAAYGLSLIHICRCRRPPLRTSRWSPHPYKKKKDTT